MRVAEKKGKSGEKGKYHRTTIFLDPVSRAYLEGLSRRDSMSQGEILRQAFRYYLEKKEHMDPDRPPNVAVTIT